MRITSAMATWRLRLSVFGSAGAVALLSAGTAASASHSIDVNFNTDSHNFSPGPGLSNAYGFGHVESGPNRCVGDRTFRLFKGTNPGILIDTGRSSKNGFFGVGGDLSGTDSVRIKMAKNRFGPRGDRHICEADTNTFFF